MSPIAASRRAFSIIALTIALGSMAGAARAAGALAIGQCGAFGQAYDFAKSSEAVAAALRQCKGQCTTVTMKRACAAVAIDLHNPCGAYGQAVAPRISSALNAATRFCYQFGGKDCVIRAWACDGRG